MAVSLGRSDVLGEQECDLAESQGSRDVSGSVFAPKPTNKINGGGTSTCLRVKKKDSFFKSSLQNTLETTLETAKTRKDVTLLRAGFLRIYILA